jgi:sn-glycerol 3-phosphate transport system ATP-binding protein
MAVVTLQGVRKVYAGNVEAVRGVSLDIEDGSFCVLVGPSGCGKSTLLRMVAGLETITDGTVRIGTREVNEVEPADRDIAMVFQNYALYPHMSVYNNMAYGLRNRGTPKAEIDARVREAARILDIATLLERKPRQLSGGQRQRVAMGRAIVRKPQVFLFDEPLSNLDAKLRVQMRVEIKRLQRSLGVTAIYVTHDQVEAMTLSDRLVVMNAGRIEQVGSPSEVYRRPQTRYVATFIGSPPMNILPGRAESDGVVGVGNGRLSVADMRRGLKAGAAVEVGLRPEDLRVGPAGSGAVDLPVDFVEELGATQLFHGKVGSAEFVVQAPTGQIAADAGALSLSINPANVHLFDPETGARLGAAADAPLRS